MLVIWDFKAYWGGGGGEDLRFKVNMGCGIVEIPIRITGSRENLGWDDDRSK